MRANGEGRTTAKTVNSRCDFSKFSDIIGGYFRHHPWPEYWSSTFSFDSETSTATLTLQLGPDARQVKK